jgi:hypothetical protein
MMAKVRRRSISPASGERLWPGPGARMGAFMAGIYRVAVKIQAACAASLDTPRRAVIDRIKVPQITEGIAMSASRHQGNAPGARSWR